MNNNLIITIGREYGTGGREIGQKLALRLGISFYDRELITRAAKKTGFDEKLFEQLDKRATNSFLYSLTMFGSVGLNGMSLTDQLYLAQANVIREIAEDAPCVVVGRCADHVLAGTERLVRIRFCFSIKAPPSVVFHENFNVFTYVSDSFIIPHSPLDFKPFFRIL